MSGRVCYAEEKTWPSKKLDEKSAVTHPFNLKTLAVRYVAENNYYLVNIYLNSD